MEAPWACSQPISDIKTKMYKLRPAHTFINTDSLSFSRFTILTATFLPEMQWMPSLTSPAHVSESHGN